MTRIIETLAEVSGDYDALLCDLWGCLHDGLTPYPEAVAALQAYRARGGKVVLLTNSPRPAAGVAQQLAEMDVPRDVYDAIVSSGDAARAGLFGGVVGQRVWHLGPEKDDNFFTDPPEGVSDPLKIERVSLDEAEGIVCTGPFHEEGEIPEDYRPTFLKAKARGLKLLCANPDIMVDRGDTRVYCAGALAALYDEMGGESLYFGKPHPPIYDLARRRLDALGVEVSASRILAVGDGMATDIKGAVLEDIDAVFVTGGLAARETGTNRQPDPVLLETYLARQDYAPRYTIGFLR
ncbi:TIGR01459 family HAD-type hydrolase [Alkalilacustris brevis]|uniref:TIGR01459 family HAD-type hydrolase n=1 Tax=Alkalilacustris brevis TaxID=2026338 RepID=UPI000E0DFC85|nr:TIGR01459 family HAD-type hydrolase [Alkalilacustris brevis]